MYNTIQYCYTVHKRGGRYYDFLPCAKGLPEAGPSAIPRHRGENHSTYRLFCEQCHCITNMSAQYNTQRRSPTNVIIVTPIFLVQEILRSII